METVYDDYFYLKEIVQLDEYQVGGTTVDISGLSIVFFNDPDVMVTEV